MLLLSLLAGSAPGLARAAPDGPGFHVTVNRLHLDGEISMVTAADMDGDGVGEVVVGYVVRDASGGPGAKRAAIYDTLDGQRYGPEPVRELALPAGCGVMDPGDVDGDGRTDLLFSASGSLWAFLQGSDGAFSQRAVRVLDFPFILPYDRSRLFSFPLFQELGKEGRQDLLVPTTGGYALFRRGEAGGFPARPTRLLPLAFTASPDEVFDYLRIHHWIPRPNRLDMNDDKVPDLAFADGNRLFFFPYDPASDSFGSVRIVDLPVQKEGGHYLVSLLADMNADGHPDAVVMRAEEKQVAVRVQAYFFLGGPGLTFRNEPDRYLEQGNQVVPAGLLDLNGNGKREFVTFTQRFNLNTLIDYFFRGRIAVEVSIYTIQDRIYGSEPTLSSKFHLKYEEEEGWPTGTDGDFNGDGRSDMVYTRAAGTLAYALGNAEEFLPKEPSLEVEAPAYGRMKTQDLNGDGKDDLSIRYTVAKRRGDFSLLVSGELPGRGAGRPRE